MKTLSNQVIIIDFFCSFTYNIVGEIYRQGLPYQVVPYHQSSEILSNLKNVNKGIVVFGPGPGTPDDYPEIFPSILPLLTNEKILKVGICLGHQMLLKLKGHKIKKSNFPVHGQREEIKIPDWGIFDKKLVNKSVLVQRYNSLTVEIAPNVVSETENIALFKNGEVALSSFPMGLTYQFHPESIGTSFPGSFFGPLHKFLYNEWDGRPGKNRWNL